MRVNPRGYAGLQWGAGRGARKRGSSLSRQSPQSRGGKLNGKNQKNRQADERKKNTERYVITGPADLIASGHGRAAGVSRIAATNRT